MINALESRRSASRYYNMTGVSWGDEIHGARVSPYAMEPDTRTVRQFSVSVPDYAETLHQFELLSGSLDSATSDWGQPAFGRLHPVSHRRDVIGATEDLQQRLANANDYFRRKATEVFNDPVSLELLVAMYRDVVMDISDFDACENGIPLARLTAANFAEIGAKVIYITDAGRRVIESLGKNRGV